MKTVKVRVCLDLLVEMFRKGQRLPAEVIEGLPEKGKLDIEVASVDHPHKELILVIEGEEIPETKGKKTPEQKITYQQRWAKPNSEGKIPKDEYEEFWKQLVENPDGTINMEKLMNELSDYSALMDNANKVYYAVTGGRLSKPGTDPQVVIDLAEERTQEAIQEAIEDL